MIKIPKQILEKINKQAESEKPLEACGYLAGIDSTAKETFPMINFDKSPEHFSFDPKEQFKVIKETRKLGLQLLAVYHSHPASPARLSAEDIRLAFDPDTIQIIHSLLDGNTKAFKIVDEKITDEEIQVIE